jgi:hypothetical protein
VYLLDSFSKPLCEHVGRVLLVDVVGGTMDMSERRRLCSRCVNSTALRLPRVVKNSGLLYLLVMNVGSEWADVVGLIDKG